MFIITIITTTATIVTVPQAQLQSGIGNAFEDLTINISVI
jgi:hypothetical protein